MTEISSAKTNGVELRIAGLQQWVRKDLNLLQDISLVLHPGEFVVIVGQSGGGKSTLVNAISGLHKPSHGQVFVDGIDLYQNYQLLRDKIGYVPQRDIIHLELTVGQALDYAAQLRLPRQTTPEQRRERVEEVLANLDLTHRKDTQVARLSGGQQKRVSIGVELLTQPSLFFLDEPTSGLDPGSETVFMNLMRRLADQGRTIALVTHATKNVMLADKVVFLARGGYLAWFGPPEEALAYFTQIRQEIGLAPDNQQMEFDQIYALLEDGRAGKAADWEKRYAASPAKQKYIDTPLQSPITAPKQLKRLQLPQPLTGIKQFFVLSSRNVRILLRDNASLALMLLSAPAMGCLDLLIAPLMGKNLFDFYQGKGPNSAMTLFLLTLYALLVGALAQMREFTKEREIFKRERLAGLRILPYVISKVWLALLLAIYHGAAFTLLRYAAFKMPGGQEEFWLFLITMAICSFSAMMLGLFASARSASPAAAPLIVIVLILPNIVLSGVLVNLPRPVSAISSTFWTFKSLVGITGIGSDVAADPCWQFPDTLRQSMTLEDKEYFGCKCQGMAVFDPQTCNFPGSGAFANASLDAPRPIEPDPMGKPPAQPPMPPAPAAPADQNDPVAIAQYLNALQDYQKSVGQIQADYAQQLAVYQSEADLYKAQASAYQKELSTWYTRRTAAVGATEAMITGVRDRFGWAFVDKNDRQAYIYSLVEAWAAMGLIDLLLFVVMIWRLKQGDRR